MSSGVQLDRLIVISRECLSLLSSDRVEEYLALESERRHLLDHLSLDLPPELRPQLEELKAVTDALSGEVARKLSELKPQLTPLAPLEQGSGYTSWA